ncbi:MAG: AzlC family ABC transporter permease [Lachnospiraceae bacterium]|nr:AzlC family ABC transporter permease [Lachnospiraceae bacterium]
MKNQLEFSQGIKDGLPIAIGYFSVSFSFGILCSSFGLSPYIAGLISLTNVTSAGQFAGLSVIIAKATLLEMILTQLVINSRYALMSLSLSQKLAPGIGTFKRCLIAFANTDEIFAVAMNHAGPVTPIYMAGLEITPILGWSLGAFTGAFANNILPVNIRSALGIALYGMFIAIVVPVAKEKNSVLAVCTLAVLTSVLFAYIPVLQHVSTGFSIIICTVIASVIGAIFFPIPNEEDSENTNGGVA